MIVRFCSKIADDAIICRIAIAPIEYFYPIVAIVAYVDDSPINGDEAGRILHFVIDQIVG